MLIQTFISELAIEAFDVRILLRFARFDESQLKLLAIRPFIEGLADKFRAIVHRHRERQSTTVCQPLQHTDDAPSRQRRIDFNCQAFFRKIIHDIQAA
jgi:hypothetical protein